MSGSKALSQAEYLKRYLSKNGDEKKKKRKIKVKKTVKIIDDDIEDFRHLKSMDEEEIISSLLSQEDAPQIVMVDDRGPTDFNNKQKWKQIAADAVEESNGLTEEKDIDDSIKFPKNSHSKRSKTDNDSDLSPRESRSKKRFEEGRTAKDNNYKKRDNGSDSDLSPPRSKSKKRDNGSDSDLSPPRSKSKKSHEDSRTSRKRISGQENYRRNNSDSDLSPPRSRSKRNHEDSRTSHKKVSGGEKYRNNNSDSDLSPPRSRSKNNYDDSGTSHKKISGQENYRRNDSDSDLSPPRSKSKRNYEDSRTSHKRTSGGEKYRRNNSDSDLSPPRSRSKKNHEDSRTSHKKVSGQENHRRNNSDSDSSPPRSKSKKNYEDSRTLHKKSSGGEKYRRNNSDSDLSPPRSRSKKNHEDSRTSHKKISGQENHRRNNSDSDLSPPRFKSNNKTHFSSSRASEKEKEPKKLKKTLDGTSAGLQNIKSLKEEEEAKKKRENEMMNKMSREMSGYGQSTVVRDRRTGRRRNLEEEAQYHREKQQEQDEINAKYAQWGRGLKQAGDHMSKLQQDLIEMDKPLARYADDEDLEKELKSRDREDDPMLAYIKTKEIKEGKRAPDKPSYSGSFMPNRFGIKPGFRWDGVDRSNGYEKKWFEQQNKKKAVEEEAYKWSIADM